MDLPMNAQIQEADVTDINLQTKDEMKPPPGEANALPAVIPLEGSESERISMLRDSPFLSRRGFGLGVILLGAAGVSSGGLIPFHRKAKVRCNLPAGYDYQVRKLSEPAVIASHQVLVLLSVAIPATLPTGTAAPVSTENAQGGVTAIAATVAPTPLAMTPVAMTPVAPKPTVSPPPAKIIRYWQSAQGDLRVDHCTVSQIAVWIDDQGYWSVNLRAAQDPFVGLDRQATPNARFLRNRFHVTVHAYGGDVVKETPALALLGKPELFRLEPTPFWVDRSQVKFHRATGYLHGAPRCLCAKEVEQLQFVDRLEVEFRYE